MATLNSRIQNRAPNEYAMSLPSDHTSNSAESRYGRSAGNSSGQNAVIQVDKIHQIHRDDLSVSFFTPIF